MRADFILVSNNPIYEVIVRMLSIQIKAYLYPLIPRLLLQAFFYRKIIRKRVILDLMKNVIKRRWSSRFFKKNIILIPYIRFREEWSAKRLMLMLLAHISAGGTLIHHAFPKNIPESDTDCTREFIGAKDERQYGSSWCL